MTVAEIKKAIANMKDTDEVIFVVERYDRDGFPFETDEEVIAIVPAGTERVTLEYGIKRYNREGVEGI
jgi:hypothetical protein